jgi:hypothetical protein
MTKLAYTVTLLHFLLSVLGLCLSYYENTFLGSFQLIVLHWFTTTFIWGATIHPDCPSLPVKLSLINIYSVGIFGGFLASPYEREENRGVALFFGFTALAVIPGCLFYAAMRSARRVLQKTYGSKTLDVSLKITTQIAASTPVVFYFAAVVVQELTLVLNAASDYSQHTPYCEYTPDNSANQYNSEFTCERGAGTVVEKLFSSLSDTVTAHTMVKISDKPVFYYEPGQSHASHYSFEAAQLMADKLESPEFSTPANSTFLLYSDYVRLVASEEHQTSAVAVLVNNIQGMVFVVSLFISQVFSRISRTTAADVVSLHVTKSELAISLFSLVSVFVAVLSSTVCPQTFAAIILPVVLVVFLCCVGQYVFIWKICTDVLNDKYRFSDVRMRRMSSEGSALHGDNEGGAAGGDVEMVGARIRTMSKEEVLERKLEDMRRKIEDMAGLIDELRRGSEDSQILAPSHNPMSRSMRGSYAGGEARVSSANSSPVTRAIEHVVSSANSSVSKQMYEDLKAI